MLNIQNYPHADYNSNEMIGYLALYYPHSGTDPFFWRHESYSPKILDFKEGREEDIKFFVEPFCALIQYALSFLKKQEAFLIPVPSSIAWNDPTFMNNPREKGNSRNRDNRNSIFCSFIQIKNNNLKHLDILFREKGKIEKEKWTDEKHKESLKIRQNPIINHEFSGVMILVDDVYTMGNTMLGAKLRLEEAYPQAKILRLSIGKSESPENFQSLHVFI